MSRLLRGGVIGKQFGLEDGENRRRPKNSAHPRTFPDSSQPGEKVHCFFAAMGLAEQVMVATY